jgi:hypothetical protein
MWIILKDSTTYRTFRNVTSKLKITNTHSQTLLNTITGAMLGAFHVSPHLSSQPPYVVENI